MTSDELRARALRMQVLLDDEDIKTAFEDIKADIMGEWERCFDPAERENLWRSVRIIERLKTWMVTAASYDMTALRRVK